MHNLFKKSDIRCQVCQAEYFQEDRIKRGMKTCPNCGTEAEPMEIKHDGYVKLNWQELRVLAIYAKRWSTVFDLSIPGDRDALTALENVLAKIGKYKPKDGAPLIFENDPIVLAKVPPPTAETKGIPSPYSEGKGLPPIR